MRGSSTPELQTLRESSTSNSKSKGYQLPSANSSRYVTRSNLDKDVEHPWLTTIECRTIMRFPMLSVIFFLLAALVHAQYQDRYYGVYNESASDILVCPSQPKAIDILCGGLLSSDRHGVMERCYPKGEDCGFPEQNDGILYCGRCMCRNGQFICDAFMSDLPGGDWSMYYAQDVGCNCNG